MHDTLAIFQFIERCRANGEASALVTLTSTTGASSRDPGTHMAVSETGAYAGSFSGGCIEAAVVGEARAALADGHPRQVLFGAGSPFIDIRLPCGGAVELLISPHVPAEFSQAGLALFAQRQPVELHLPMAGVPVALPSGTRSKGAYWQGSIFHVHHMPPLRIIVLGNGAQVEALFLLANGFGAQVETLTPDAEIVAKIHAAGGTARLLHMVTQAANFAVDPWTACVCLFHDHDWEADALHHAAANGAFYVGAMGSVRTAETRRTAMLENGVAAAVVARIKGPIGLMQRSRDPGTLALSVLAEIVDDYNRFTAPSSQSEAP